MTRRRMASLAVLAAVCCLSCSDDVSVETVNVLSEKEMCSSAFLTTAMCPVVIRASGNRSARGVEGFSHKWGHRYTLTVRVEKAPDNLADAPAEFLRLVTVTGETTVSPGREFNLRLRPIVVVEWDEGAGTGILGNPPKAFRVTDPAVRQALSAALQGPEEDQFETTLEYGDPITSDLLMTDVLSSE